MDSTLRVDAVWDIETAHWDEFVAGALWTQGRGVEVFRDEDEMAGALLSLPTGVVAWAHAGGRFDVLWLLDWCHRHGAIPNADIRMSGSTIAALKIHGGPTFRDSYRLVPMALKKACGMFGGVVKVELSLPCICGRGCAGYCSISRDMPPEHRARMEEYLIADVEALRDVLLGLVTYCAGHGLKIKGTVASSSWASARVHCPGLDDADWDLRAYRFARAGYYGGMVAVARTEADQISRYDRVSAYPAALLDPVPVGDLRLVSGRTARAVWGRGRPGIYRATVDVPEMLAPPLPVRVANRIAYPWGRVTGTWPRDELARAVECGAKIIDVTGACVWADEHALYRPYVEHVWSLRRDALAQSPALGAWLKWLANSLTGALAQDPEHDIFRLGDMADDPEWSSVGGRDWIWRRTVFRISDRAHVHHAATLTARARTELHRQIEHAGDDWVYSDTDSCIATRRLTRAVGDELGQWKHEGDARNWRALAPKVYRYEPTDGSRPVVRAKGISDAAEAWPAILRGERAVNEAGVKSFLSAARGGGAIFERGRVERVLRLDGEWCGARIIDGTRTRPPSADDLARLPR